MNLPEFCVVTPDGDDQQFVLHRLERSGSLSGDSFVIIPYVHPEKEKIKTDLYAVISTEKIRIVVGKAKPLQVKPTISREEYLRHVRELKENIQQGDIYEINYCMEFSADNIAVDPLSLFSELCSLARAPFSFLVKIKDEYIICASPELFLKKEGELLITKPIKGTIKRDADPAIDAQLKQELYASLKERTENVMAVDVARNDLSQVAQKGSVAVNKLYNIESYESVHQMVSTVSCKIKPGTGLNEIIKATFPMASMTGAPKISAMNLIDKHEDFARNYYSGTVGFVRGNGDFTLPVIIRSIFYNDSTKRLSFAVGGAITYLSEPEKEYNECLLKAKNILKALNAEIVT